MINNSRYLLALLVLPLLTGCSAVETIFKAGMWWAFILIFLVIAGILWVISRVKK